MPHFDYSPDAYLQQFQAKKIRLQDLLSEFNALNPKFLLLPSNTTACAEFRLWREGNQRHYAMFAPGDNRTLFLLKTFRLRAS